MEKKYQHVERTSNFSYPTTAIDWLTEFKIDDDDNDNVADESTQYQVFPHIVHCV